MHNAFTYYVCLLNLNLSVFEFCHKHTGCTLSLLPFLGRLVLKLHSMFTSGVVFERYGLCGLLGEPVWLSGKALGW